jgi:hypothetical protein
LKKFPIHSRWFAFRVATPQGGQENCHCPYCSGIFLDVLSTEDNVVQSTGASNRADPGVKIIGSTHENYAKLFTY